MVRKFISLTGLLLCLTSLARPHAADESPSVAERRALAYLQREVPRWSAENKCYSCHNNGDAARALYLAVRHGHDIPPKALSETTAWLAQPQHWDKNGGEGPYSDKKLARLQFAAALAEGTESGLVKERQALIDAAAMVAAQQQPNGAWQVTVDGALGSPATHGTALNTTLARRTLQKADARRFHAPITKAETWLRTAPAKTVLDAAGVLLGLTDDATADAAAQRQTCLALLRAGQAPDGGWGPTVKDSPEVFDTAVVVAALAGLRDKELGNQIDRGRTFLVAMQKDDGSWPETTRPSGNVSYAQRVSTSAWATMALLATRERVR